MLEIFFYPVVHRNSHFLALQVFRISPWTTSSYFNAHVCLSRKKV